MTEDEIIELAKKYHFGYEFENSNVLECYKFSKEEFIAFVKLVAEKEREAWSKVCEDIRKVFNEKADLAYIAGQKEEREACAMLCLWHNNTMLSQTPTLFHMAELIRARGQA